MFLKNMLKKTNPYKDHRIIGIFFLGFSSGLPFLLLLSTLSIWLTKVGVSKTNIGLFSWVTFPYALKFLLAPFLDNFNFFFLDNLLGRRKTWLISSQLGLSISICGLGFSDPEYHLINTALWALLVAFFSSIQDIVYEAYRMEILKGPLSGYSIGASVMGYRIGLLFSGAGALYLEVLFNWSFAYAIMSCCMIVGMFVSLVSIEPIKEDRIHHKEIKNFYHSFVIIPINILFNRENIIFIVIFLMFYKVGDTILNVMSMPFLLEIGFSEMEIAYVAKFFGITAMILGGFAGGILLAHRSLRYALFLCSIAQFVASIIFIIQSIVGYNISFLFLTMGVENFVCGISQTALIAYFADFCQRPFTATHYAILSSIGSFVRIILSSISGWVADHMVWTLFYSSVTLGCLPSLLLLLFFSEKFISKPKIIYSFLLKNKLKIY